jgi:hypothetical protein
MTGEQRATIVEALRAAGLPESLAAHMQVTERAVSTATPALPIRENLEGKRRPGYPDDEPGIERYIREVDGKWCVYSESGEKLGEHDTEAEAKAQLAAIEANKDKKRIVLRVCWQIFHPETHALLARFDSKEAAEECVRALQSVYPGVGDPVEAADSPPDVERAAPSAETVSSPEPGDTLTRLATAEAEITRLQAAHEETLTRLAAVTQERDGLTAEVTRHEATIERQAKLLAEPRDLPPARFAISALAREFMANAGERESADTAALQGRYDDAKAKAGKEPDFAKRRALVVEMGQIQTQLAQRGVKVD